MHETTAVHFVREEKGGTFFFLFFLISPIFLMHGMLQPAVRGAQTVFRRFSHRETLFSHPPDRTLLFESSQK